MRPALHFWGFLMDRVDARIAVSPMAAESASRWLPGDYRVIPNGVLIPEQADPADRDHTVVFVGRHDPRKGLPTLLRAWPHIHAATGARLRVIGTDPLQYRLLHARLRVRRGGHRRARDRAERSAHARARAGEAVRSRRRSAARASGSCSPRRSPARRPPSHPTSRATPPSRPRGCAARSAERPRRAGRRCDRRALRRAPPSRDGPCRARARGRELRVGRHRTTSRGDLRRGRRLMRARCALACAARRPGDRGRGRALRLSRARTGISCTTHSPPCAGAGCSPRSGSTCSRCCPAPVAWDTAIKQSLDPPTPRFPLVFSAFSRRSVRERGAAGPRRRARAGRRAPPAHARPYRSDRDA